MGAQYNGLICDFLSAPIRGVRYVAERLTYWGRSHSEQGRAPFSCFTAAVECSPRDFSIVGW